MRWCVLVLLCACLCSCRENPEEGGSGFIVTSYNVENLFDAESDGSEYPEYVPSESWTDETVKARLSLLGDTLLSKELRKSHLFVLQEVENENLVRRLVESRLGSHGYGYYGFAKKKGDAVGIAFISRLKPDWMRVHEVAEGRPLLELAFHGGSLVVVALHAKSRLGGEAETEEARLEAARMVKAIRADNPSALVVVTGDFNEDPDASASSTGQTALVLSDLGTAGLWDKRGSLVLTGRKAFHDPLWYCPWLDMQTAPDGRGSCAWGGVWHRYDSALLSQEAFDGSGWEFSSFSVYRDSRLVGSDGLPLSWDRKTLSGASDHLPVTLSLYSL